MCLKKMRKLTAPGGILSVVEVLFGVLLIMLIIESFSSIGSGILNMGPLHTRNRAEERIPLYFRGPLAINRRDAGPENFWQDFIIGYYGGDLALNSKTGDALFEPYAWTLEGVSNGVSGFIIYQVPKGADPKDFSLIGEFSSFGRADWRLA